MLMISRCKHSVLRLCTCFVLMGVMLYGVSAVAVASVDHANDHKALAVSKAGAEPLPMATPSSLAKRFTKYMKGRWDVVGSSTDGKKLLAGRVMAYPVAGLKFLAISYKSDQYTSLDKALIQIKDRQAFMMMYFGARNQFNLLSFQKSGKIKHYQGHLTYRRKRYVFVSDPFKMGPLRARVMFSIKPINDKKYTEDFSLQILAPGSKKVMQEKKMFRMIFTKKKSWHKKKS